MQSWDKNNEKASLMAWVEKKSPGRQNVTLKTNVADVQALFEAHLNRRRMGISLPSNYLPNVQEDLALNEVQEITDSKVSSQ